MPQPLTIRASARQAPVMALGDADVKEVDII
jgi:hypothetical protein